MVKNHLSNQLPDFLKKWVIKSPTLISWVTEIDISDIMDEYQRSSHYYSQHMYWERSADKFVLYGVAPISDSYETIITNQDNIKGTGPIELSASSFDDKQHEVSPWESLSSSFSFVPSILLTEHKGQFFLTLNFVVNEEDDLLTCWQTIIKKWHFFLAVNQQQQNQTSPIESIIQVGVSDWIKSVNQTIAMLKTSTSLKKVVMARQLKITFQETIDIPTVLIRLRHQQPNTYRFVVRNEEAYFIGASPERLLEATQTKFYTSCVAGSIRRGPTDVEDEQLGNELLLDEKNQIEHNYVVQWLTSEMKKITVQLDKNNAITLLKNRDIQHLFLPISGIRRPHISFKEAVSILHPSPALGGIPKNDALKWIRTHESLSRGLYGGPLGWHNKKLDIGEMIVGIRSGLIKDNQAILYAGCGIVPSSDVELEKQETAVKFQPMLRALGGL